MKNFLFLFVGLALLSSCSKEGEGQFDLNFKALFADEALILNTAYELDDIEIKFENLTYFVTDIAILNSNDERVELAEVALVQLNGFDESAANEGQKLSFEGVPSGSYKRLYFTIGVPEDLNSKMPGDFQVDEPLGRADHYWESWGSYIFSKTEGSADVDGDGVFDLKYFYHTGSNALLRSFEIDANLTIDNDETSTIELFMDYNELLRNADGTAFDIEQFPRNHDPTKLDLVTQYVDNYQRALKVRK